MIKLTTYMNKVIYIKGTNISVLVENYSKGDPLTEVYTNNNNSFLVKESIDYILKYIPGE